MRHSTSLFRRSALAALALTVLAGCPAVGGFGGDGDRIRIQRESYGSAHGNAGFHSGLGGPIHASKTPDTPEGIYMASAKYREMKAQKEEEARRKAEEARKKAEEEAKKKAEEEAKKKEEEQNGGTNPPGSGGTNPPGSGGTNPPGSGGTNPPGSGGTNPPGSGGTNPPGSGGTNPPGSGGTNPPGSGGTNPPGSGGTNPPGSGGNNNPMVQFDPQKYARDLYPKIKFPSGYNGGKVDVPNTVMNALRNFQETALDLVNDKRARAGRVALRLDDSLNAYATVRSNELLARNSHDRPNGQDALKYIRSNIAAENIARNYTGTAKSFIDQWMDSKGHRDNILNSSVRTMGIGVAPDGKGNFFSAQVFGGSQVETDYHY